MPGRKRKPAKLHLIQGTAQPCRMNKNEPVAPDDIPRPACEIGERESYWYGILVGRIQSLGIASSTDSEMVMLAAQCLADVETCQSDIKENGRNYTKIELLTLPDGTIKAQKMLKANPAVAQLSDLRRNTQSLLNEFGLSPASRGKVSATGKKAEESNPWEAFK
jgi:P27 family predicted phage terminase small subunit